jgi:hypothetical protein
MTTFPTFRDMATRIGPRWLRGDNASRVLYAPGLVNDSDAVVSAAGLRAGLPGLCNEDALPYLGRDRLITRGPSEPADLYAARLMKARDAHSRRGSTPELLEQLRHWWSPNFRTITFVQNNSIWYQIDPSGVVTRTDHSTDATPNWVWDKYSPDNAPHGPGWPSPRWWRFWIIVSGAPFFKWKWGDGHRYGDKGLVWGSTVPSWWINGLRGIIRTWKSQDAVCDRVIMTYDDTLFLPSNAPGPNMPDGTWDVAANRATAASYIQGVA